MSQRWAVVGSYNQTENYLTGQGKRVFAFVTEYKGLDSLQYKVEKKALHNTYTDKDTALRMWQAAKLYWKDGPVSVSLKRVRVGHLLKVRKAELEKELRAINAELRQ